MRRATLLNILPSGARRLTLPLLLSVLLPQGAAVAGVVDIERTTDGIPHIRAQNWGGALAMHRPKMRCARWPRGF